MTTPTIQTIHARIDAAIAVFIANDIHLLKVRTSERSMCHKLAEALQQVFKSWHLDCEYNRDGKRPKVLPDIKYDQDRSVFPDIIIHRRGKPDNLLVLEAKCSDSNPDLVKKDIGKLDLYRSEIGYKYSVLLTFHVGKNPRISYEIKKG